MVFHMSKEQVDNSDTEHLTNIIPMGMDMFKYIMSSFSGNSNPGVGTGYSSSKAK